MQANFPGKCEGACEDQAIRWYSVMFYAYTHTYTQLLGFSNIVLLALRDTAFDRKHRSALRSKSEGEI